MKVLPCFIIAAITAVFLITPVVADSNWPALRDCADAKLQDGFEKSITAHFGAKFWDLAKANKVSIVIAEITDPHHPKVAAINGDLMMYAASLPKIAILLGAFVEIERGNLKLGDALREELIRMIRNSSNKAATAVLAKVGIANLAEILQSDRYRLYDPQYGGGLWVGRDYSGGPVWQRDPLHGISHGASAMQAARWFYLAVTQRLVLPQYQEELTEIISKPAINHKFVKGLANRSDTEIYRKSGTWKNFHADGGVIIHKNAKYIVIALIEHHEGGQDLSKLIVIVDDLIESQ